MTDMPTLKPCPFCGEQPRQRGNGPSGPFLQCQTEGCVMQDCDPMIPSLWNTRAVSADENRLRAEIAALSSALTSAQERLHGRPATICRKCGGKMRPGTAMFQTFTQATPDLRGEVMTVNPGGPGKLAACMKCEDCGHSYSIGDQNP